jgi:hypothetical protein
VQVDGVLAGHHLAHGGALALLLALFGRHLEAHWNKKWLYKILIDAKLSPGATNFNGCLKFRRISIFKN